MLVKLFSALVRLFLIHLSIFYRKMPSLDKRNFYFIIKKPFLECLNTRLFKSKLNKFFPWHYISYLYPGDIEAKTLEKREKIKKRRSKITFLLKRHLHLLSILIKDSIIFHINPSRQNISLHAYTDSSPFYLIQTRYIGLTHTS